MKKYILSFALILPLALFSQEIDIRGYGGIGLIGLTSQKDLVTINNLDYKLNIGATPLVQLGAALTLGNKFYIQPGVAWQRIVLEITKTETFGEKKKFEEEYNLSMITFPLKAGVRLLDAEKFENTNVRLFGGFDGQVITGLKETKVSNLNDLEKADFNKLITYGEFGMGVDLFFLFADVGYRIGLNPILNSGNPSRASTLYSNIGIRINL